MAHLPTAVAANAKRSLDEACTHPSVPRDDDMSIDSAVGMSDQSDYKSKTDMSIRFDDKGDDERSVNSNGSTSGDDSGGDRDFDALFDRARRQLDQEDQSDCEEERRWELLDPDESMDRIQRPVQPAVTYNLPAGLDRLRHQGDSCLNDQSSHQDKEWSSFCTSVDCYLASLKDAPGLQPDEYNFMPCSPATDKLVALLRPDPLRRVRKVKIINDSDHESCCNSHDDASDDDSISTCSNDDFYHEHEQRCMAASACGSTGDSSSGSVTMETPAGGTTAGDSGAVGISTGSPSVGDSGAMSLSTSKPSSIEVKATAIVERAHACSDGVDTEKIKRDLDVMEANLIDEILIAIGAAKRGNTGKSLKPKKKKIQKWLDASADERLRLFKPAKRKKRCGVPDCNKTEDDCKIRIIPQGNREEALDRLGMSSDKRSDIRLCVEHFNQAIPETSNDSSEETESKHYSYKCAMPGCNNNNLTPGVFLPRIPPPVGKPPGPEARKESFESFVMNKERRRLALSALGRKRTDESEDIRVCDDHELEDIACNKEYLYKGETEKIEFKVRMFKSTGVKALAATTSKGLGRDRAAAKMLSTVNEEAKHGGEGTAQAEQNVKMLEDQASDLRAFRDITNELGISDEAKARLAGEVEKLIEKSKKIHGGSKKVASRMKSAERGEAGSLKALTQVGNTIMHTPGKPRGRTINSAVAEAAGIAPSSAKKPTSSRRKGAKSIFYSKRTGETKKRANQFPPHVKPGNDASVQRRTGFKTDRHMLFFIFAVCNGDLDLAASTTSTMTWYEEWFFFFELVQGCSLRRWEDAAANDGTGYAINESVLYNIFRSKLRLALICRLSWPAYASFEEDMYFRKPEWDRWYKNDRILMTDDSNVSLGYKPSDSGLQSATHSRYYGENCLKGAVQCQLMGCIRTVKLFTGAVSDTDYDT